MTLFDSLIKPILLYGCQVLTPHLNTIIKLASISHDDAPQNYAALLANGIYEKFHLQFLKWCLGVHRKPSNIGTWGESGRIPLIINAIKLSVDYFQRVERLSDNSLVSKAFAEQKQLHLDWYTTNTRIIEKFADGKSKISID